jgi:hypothetical protein
MYIHICIFCPQNNKTRVGNDANFSPFDLGTLPKKLLIVICKMASKPELTSYQVSGFYLLFIFYAVVLSAATLVFIVECNTKKL